MAYCLTKTNAHHVGSIWNKGNYNPNQEGKGVFDYGQGSEHIGEVCV